MGIGFVLVCTLIIEWYVLRRLRFDWLTVATVAIGTMLCVHYLGYTSVSERSYDASAQIEYIRSLADHGRLPNVFGCGACGHPPAYYALAALWTKLMHPFTWLTFELGLQWFSLLAFFGYVVAALTMFRSSEAGPAAFRVASILIVFWPSSIIHSIRVHNDALVSPLLVAAIHFMAQWDRGARRRDFAIALAMSALALVTKSSAYPVALSLVGLAAWRMGTPSLRREASKSCAVAVVVLAAAAILPVAVRESRVPTTLCQKVVGLACDGRYVPAVPDTVAHFVRFDAGAFIRDLVEDEPLAPGDTFPNRFAKSSLLGMMPLGDELGGYRQRLLAGLMGALLLTMVVIGSAGFFFMRREHWRKYRVYLATPLVMFAFLVAFRVRAPNAFHEDFRHIFPVLAMFCLGYARAIERIGRSSRLLGYAGIGVGVSMAAASAVFFVRA